MSRQFDEYMEDKFEYQGERKTLIYPTSFAELTEALGVRNTLQSIMILLHAMKIHLAMRK